MAALITVMVLVLVMSITFAFANRSLIFEQRTGANQMRSTQALAVAEAGIDWAVALLNNSPALTATCTSGTGATNKFAERYLNIDSTTREITPRDAQPGCVINANGDLACSCPTSGAPTLSGAGGRFTVTFSAANPARPRMVRITSAAHSNESLDGAASVSIVLAEVRTANPTPKAALTARGNVSWQGAVSSLYVANSDPNTNGISINAGGNVDLNSRVNLMSVPGTPQGNDTALSVVSDDPSIRSMTTADQYFTSMMGASKADYYSGAVQRADASGLETAVNATAGTDKRAFWIGPAPGAAASSYSITGGTFGSATDPVILVFNGDVEIRGATTIYGVLYVAGGTMTNRGGGNSLIQGAVISEGDYADGNGSREVIFDPNILAALTGGTKFSKFRKLPGSWLD
ncbi:PilX N-terminal domain-containing pilus assembly protein [Caldimonas tepidiphila]|uniref:PilX N-terminal domain-containing pilus assembly protein n=1 Tax=Caldimonas tepidiphila TaxID=2315841 RepID=UPI0014756F5F|nr:pilus assembly PilX N-terminal domain-containing protein [Caldimonas tepidiphila]